MSDNVTRILTIVSALGSGLVAGIFFAFSTFIMKSLNQLAPAEGIRAMQEINKEAPNGWFMSVLFGTAAVGAVLAVPAVRHLDDPGAGYRIAGFGLYMIGIVLTIAYHVPRNNALDAIHADSAGAAGFWRHYVSTWTAWNHLRTLGALAAALTYTLSLRTGWR